MENPTIAYIIIAVIVVLLAASFTVQTIRTNRMPLGKVLKLYREVKFNEKTARHFGYKGRQNRFRTELWLLLKNDLGFLPEEILNLLTRTYDDIFKINDTLDASGEAMQESFFNTVNVDPLQQPLNEAVQRLDMWIKRNLNNPEYAPKKPRWFGF